MDIIHVYIRGKEDPCRTQRKNGREEYRRQYKRAAMGHHRDKEGIKHFDGTRLFVCRITDCHWRSNTALVRAGQGQDRLKHTYIQRYMCIERYDTVSLIHCHWIYSLMIH